MIAPLHVHSHFSLMRGLDRPEILSQKAKQYGYTHLAITDTNGFYGLIEFLTAAKEEEIIPIVGCEFRLPQKDQTGLDHEVQFVALAKSREGYQGMCELLTHAHQHTLNPYQFLNFFKTHAQDLVVFSSDLELLKLIQGYFRPEEMSLYYEVAKGFTTFRQIQAAQELGLPLLATTHTHYVEPGRDLEYKLVRAIDQNKTLDEVNIKKEHNFHCYLPAPREMEAWFNYLPEALANTEKVARMCEADWFQTDVVFPLYEGQNENECAQLLKENCLKGISKRWPVRSFELEKEIHKRLKYELDIIITKGYASYFLVVQDIVEQSNINCGRGSAAASLVSYLLGITHVDPIKHNLFFDRFLNPQRADPPDIDIDFPWDERDDVIDYVFKKYGNHAAMVANHNYLRGKSAAREVAKVFGIRQDEITYVLDRLPRIKLNPKWENILKLSTRIEGIVRHLSVHCGGVVITPRPVHEYVPVEISKKGPPVIQWEKDQTEDAGLVKIDLLGNRSLAVIRDTINTINNKNSIHLEDKLEMSAHTTAKHTSGLQLISNSTPSSKERHENSRSLNQTLTGDVPLKYETLNPIGDQGTEASLVAGDTMGVFYIESPATRLFLKKMKSGDFEHIVIAGSIIRPAANKYGNEFVRRLQGGHFRYLHPALEEILHETFGIMIYQEDVTKVAMKIAGFNSFEGNELRKVLGKKHKEKKLRHYKEKFFQGGKHYGVSNSVLVQLWEMILSFAGYSFCKPHSASYALVSMKSCFLKTHYPAEFMAAVISNQGGFYSTDAYVDEARRMGLKILPPDVNYSELHYTGHTNHTKNHENSRGFLRVGLMQIKHLSRECIDGILLERQQGPFQDIHDFLNRVRPHFKDTRLLIMSRALRSLCRNNESLNDLMWELYSHQAKKEGLILPDTTLPSAACRREYSPGRLVNWEQQLLQGCITFPSWLFFQEYLQQHNVLQGIELKNYIGKEITIFGKKVTQKRVLTKDRMEMCFTSFSDDVSIYETVFFPNAYAAFRDLLFLGGNFLIKGVVQEEYDAIQLQVTDLKRCEFPNLMDPRSSQERINEKTVKNNVPEHLKIS